MYSMFSRLYQSARALFTDIPQNEKIQPAKVVESLRDEMMVTPRQRHSQEAAGEEIDDENSINVYVPNSGNERQKRAKDEDVVILSDSDDASFTPTSSRKRKRLPVRAKDAEGPDPAKTRPVVEIPLKKISPEPDHGNDITIGNEVAVTVEKNEEKETEAAESLGYSKHRRFGSEQAEDGVFSTEREVAADEENSTSKTAADGRIIEDSEDSEDEAPEAVDVQEAAKNVKLKDRDAAKAVKDQLSAIKKKRKGRDEVLKRQAESSKKRKLETDLPSTKKLAGSSSKQDSSVPEADLDVGDKEVPSVVENGSAKHEILSGIAIQGRGSLPKILPAEYLEDTETQETMLLDELPRKKAKKTKFQTMEKEPKDRRIGSTTYRVTKASSTNLAPKSSSQSRNTKESWLKGRSGKSVDASRKPFSKGFFKK